MLLTHFFLFAPQFLACLDCYFGYALVGLFESKNTVSCWLSAVEACLKSITESVHLTF
jgi:hypothetical protein